MKRITTKKKAVLFCFLLSLLTFGCSAKQTDKQPTNDNNMQKNLIEIDATASEQEGVRYQTLAAAINYVNQNPPTTEKERITITLKEGVYREHITLTAPYITLRAEKSDKDSAKQTATLTYYYGADNIYHSTSSEAVTIGSSASTIIADSAHDFIAENIVFENSYNLYVTEAEQSDYIETNKFTVEERSENPSLKKFQTQACAIRVDADRSIFKNCSLIGRQDTVYLNNFARCYFENCFIEGTADFICGGATAWFENCTLNCPYNAGYVSASASGSSNPYGYLFKNCQITKNCPVKGMEPPKDGDYALGRPWRCTPTVIFWNCKMDSHIVSGEDRFINMTSEYSREDCTVIECNSMDINGMPLDMTKVAASYETILNENEMNERYSISTFFDAQYNESSESFETADHWNPQLH